MQTADSEGPAWNKFWLSLDNDTESQISDGTSARMTPSIRGPESIIRGGAGGAESPLAHRHQGGLNQLDRHDSVLQPNDSASHIGDHSDHGSMMMEQAADPMDQPFPFKFKAPSGRIFRVQVAPNGGLIELLGAVVEKMGNEVADVGGEPEFGSDGKLSNQGFAVSYADDEGDIISITSDSDLVDAVNMSRRVGRDKVDLFVHDPTKPPLAATVDPKPAIAPKKKVSRDESSEDDEEEEHEHARKQRKRYQTPPEPVVAPTPEVIPGVPNELLLPGAIATLAVVIVAVFAMSRGSR